MRAIEGWPGMMTNRERARTWLLDTYPSAWEAEHVESLTTMLNGIVKLDRVVVLHKLKAAAEQYRIDGYEQIADAIVALTCGIEAGI